MLNKVERSDNMSLEGNARSEHNLRGKVNRLYELRGYSAYETAVIQGFKGTEDEWLESLKAVLTEEDRAAMVNKVLEASLLVNAVVE